MAELLLGNSSVETANTALLTGVPWASYWEAEKTARLEVFKLPLTSGAQTATSVRFALTTQQAGAGSKLPATNALLFEGVTSTGIKASGTIEVALAFPIELVKGRIYHIVLLPIGGEIHIFNKEAIGTKTAAKAAGAPYTLISEVPESKFATLTKVGQWTIEGLGTTPVGILREKVVSDLPAGQTQVLATLTTEAAKGATTWSTSAAAPTSLQGGQFRVVVGFPNARGEIEGGEYYTVTGATSTTWTVVPGREGSPEVAHAFGQSIYHVLTAGSLEGIAASPESIDIAKCKGVDRTGVADSTIGIMEAVFAARKENRVLRASAGKYLVEGLIELGGVGLRGDGSGNTVFTKNSTDGKMFTVSFGPATVRDFSVENLNHAATVGSFIVVETQNLELAENTFSNEVKIENIALHQPFNGLEVRNTGGTYIHNFIAENVVNSGVWTHSKAVEQLFNTFVLAANETITLEGKSNAVLLKLEGENSGSVFENGEILLGKSGMQSIAQVPGTGTGKSVFNIFSNCFFDSGREPIVLNGSQKLKFNQCWFSVRPGGGTQIIKCEDISFTACEWVGNATYCVQIDEPSTFIRIENSAIGGGENVAIANIELTSTSRFTITGNNFLESGVANPCIEIKKGVGESKAFNITNNVTKGARTFITEAAFAKTKAERNGIETGNVGQTGAE